MRQRREINADPRHAPLCLEELSSPRGADSGDEDAGKAAGTAAAQPALACAKADRGNPRCGRPVAAALSDDRRRLHHVLDSPCPSPLSLTPAFDVDAGARDPQAPIATPPLVFPGVANGSPTIPVQPVLPQSPATPRPGARPAALLHSPPRTLVHDELRPSLDAQLSLASTAPLLSLFANLPSLLPFLAMPAGPPVAAPPPSAVRMPPHARIRFPGERADERCCTCQKPAFGDMVACESDTCPIEWFHLGCVGLSHVPDAPWLCPPCSLERQLAPGLPNIPRGVAPPLLSTPVCNPRALALRPTPPRGTFAPFAPGAPVDAALHLGNAPGQAANPPPMHPAVSALQLLSNPAFSFESLSAATSNTLAQLEAMPFAAFARVASTATARGRAARGGLTAGGKPRRIGRPKKRAQPPAPVAVAPPPATDPKPPPPLVRTDSKLDLATPVGDAPLGNSTLAPPGGAALKPAPPEATERRQPPATPTPTSPLPPGNPGMFRAPRLAGPVAPFLPSALPDNFDALAAVTAAAAPVFASTASGAVGDAPPKPAGPQTTQSVSSLPLFHLHNETAVVMATADQIATGKEIAVVEIDRSRFVQIEAADGSIVYRKRGPGRPRKAASARTASLASAAPVPMFPSAPPLRPLTSSSPPAGLVAPPPSSATPETADALASAPKALYIV